MNVTKILADLRQERDQIETAIQTLERLAIGRGKRRGRPPSWLAAARKRGQSSPAKRGPVATSIKSSAVA